jgi:ribose 5-phosphate isomerase B
MHPVGDALAFVDAFLDQAFTGGERHARRIAMLAAYETDGVLPPLP